MGGPVPEKRGLLMHRFYVEEPISGPGQAITLSKEESAHAARVLRLRPGEEVRLLDGQSLWAAVMETVDEKASTVRVEALCESPEASCHAVLFQGLPKADKLEMIVQKGTELGMSALWPVEMERSVARMDKSGRDEKKRERMQRIALEAAKQSGRACVPEIGPAMSFARALDIIRQQSFDLILVAWEEEHALPLSKAVQQYLQTKGQPQSALIVIGPEGGISPAEYEQLHQLGAVSVTLGKRILRTETAGLCALSVLWTALGEM